MKPSQCAAGILGAIILVIFLCRCLPVWRAVHANRAAANLFDADASPRSRRQFLPTSGAHVRSTSYQTTPQVNVLFPNCSAAFRVFNPAALFYNVMWIIYYIAVGLL